LTKSKQLLKFIYTNKQGKKMQSTKEVIEQLNEKCGFDFKESQVEYAEYICNKTGAKIYKNLDTFFLDSASDSLLLCFYCIEFGEYRVQTFNGINLAFECPLEQLIQFFKTSI